MSTDADDKESVRRILDKARHEVIMAENELQRAEQAYDTARDNWERL